MWGMLNSEGEAWISWLVIFMLLIVVRCQILPTTFRIFTHMDPVHTAQIHIIVLATVHYRDNFPIFYMSRWTPIFSVRGMNQILISTPQTGATILISHGKLMLREVMLPNLMDCTILNISNPIIHLPILQNTTIHLNNLRWKKLSRNSCN